MTSLGGFAATLPERESKGTSKGDSEKYGIRNRRSLPEGESKGNNALLTERKSYKKEISRKFQKIVKSYTNFQRILFCVKNTEERNEI